MEKINNYYVDSNNNKWNCDKFTKEEAMIASKTLQNHDKIRNQQKVLCIFT